MVFEKGAEARRLIFAGPLLGIVREEWIEFWRGDFADLGSDVDFTLSWMALVVGTPGFSEMYTTGTRPLTSSTSGTTAASAISPMVRQADSTSLVPRRWPATLITSSTRPRMRE